MDQLNEFLLISANNIFPSELENSKVDGESFISQGKDEFLSLLSELVLDEHEKAAKHTENDKEILSSLFVEKPTFVIEEENIDNFKDKDEMSELLERINGSNQLLSKNMDDKKKLVQNEEKFLQDSAFTHKKNSYLPVNNQDVLNNEQNKIDIDASIHIEKALIPQTQTIDRSNISSAASPAPQLNILSQQKNENIVEFLSNHEHDISFISSIKIQKIKNKLNNSAVNPLLNSKGENKLSIFNHLNQNHLGMNSFLNANKIPTETNSFNESAFIHQLATGLDSQAVTSLNKSELSQLNTISSSQRELVSESLLERVNIMLAKNLKQADIYLDPPELGRLQIRLAVNQDTASVQFTVTNQVTREIIEQSIPKLKEMFQQHGLQIAQSSIQQETNTQQGFTGGQMQQQNREQRKNSTSQIIRGQEIENEDRVINLRLDFTQPKDAVDYYA